jgi:hypothetical protein
MAFRLVNSKMSSARVFILAAILVLKFFSASIALTSNASLEGFLNINGNELVTGVVTAAAFNGVFNGTYTGADEKAATFLYPYLTAEATIRLPFNANIIAVEVYCVGGTSVTGQVYNNGADVGSATANAGSWATDASLTNTTYTSGNNIRFFTPAISGIVTSATVLMRYQRTP